MATPFKILYEMTYKGNLGFEEMLKLYDVATDEQIKEIEKVAKKNDWKKFKKLVGDILGVKLK